MRSISYRLKDRVREVVVTELKLMTLKPIITAALCLFLLDAAAFSKHRARPQVRVRPAEYPALQRFLKSHPEYAILTRQDLPDFVRDDKDYLSQFRPLISGDANGDGITDVVVMLVERGGERRYGVLCLHGGRTPIWVVKPRTDFVLSIRIDKGPAQVVVWDCWGCDVAGSYRWSGRDYEEGLLQPGEKMKTTATVQLWSSPGSGGRVVTRLSRGTRVVILRTVPGTTGEDRWYEVRVSPGPSAGSIGFLQGKTLVYAWVED